MKFVELNRSIILVKESDKPNLDFEPIWERYGARTLGWADFRSYWRVLLLAEASCGKSAEFLNQSDSLVAEGRAAFYVRIEELADQGFETALEPSASDLFEQWRHGTEEGWFFLDSVDEARLNHKSFESALKRFARELREAVNRAHIFISCRVSDWKGTEDVDTIQRLLPFKDSPPPVLPEVDPNKLLLDPIFESPKSEPPHQDNESTSKPHELKLIQLVALTSEQRRLLALAANVENIDKFMASVSRMGLDDFSERPGDLLELVDYWNSYQRFDRLAQMVEHGIQQKLRERDPDRRDNNILSPQKAREGAERIAAALTFCKTFTLRSSGYGPDPKYTSGALNSTMALPDWTDAQRTALLRRGIFAPATYGQVRFHHRSTQEYLTAKWLDRLLNANCPLREVWDCIFTEQYGIETVVPSLRPAAAWLALWQPEICKEIIRREPMVLLQHGDPGSLPLNTRKQLLITYAQKHAAAEISDTRIDHRAMWLFADRELADAIRTAWHINSHEDFKWKLLGFIEQEAIKECVDLAREVARDTNADDYNRIIAVEALKACDDQQGLAEIAQIVAQTPAAWSARLASKFAIILFPKYLSVQDVLALIADSTDTEKNRGFHFQLLPLYEACPDEPTRVRFVTGLNDLCLSPPFIDDYQRISERYQDLAAHLHPLAVREIQLLREQNPPNYLIRLLMAVERAERHSTRSTNQHSLNKLVQENWRLKRTLFWADVDENSTNIPGGHRPVWHWRFYLHGEPLWQLGEQDLSWLYENILHCDDHEKRRIALRAVVAILRSADKLADERARLSKLVGQDSILITDLQDYLKPPVQHEDRENKVYAARRAQQEKADKASWVKLKDQLQENPDQLRDLSNLPIGLLIDLTEWLCRRTNEPYHSAPLQWRLLGEGFGSAAIAEAYRDSMKAVWRVAQPERPQTNEQGQATTKWTMILSFAGIGIESAEDPNWVSYLSAQEAERAALHSFWAEQDHPKWFDKLIEVHPQVALPVLKEAIIREWSSASYEWPRLLHAYSNASVPLQPAVEQVLFDSICGEEPIDANKLGRSLRVIQRLNLNEGQKRQLIQLGRSRLSNHVAANNEEYALHYLALLFLLDTENSVKDLADWIEYAPPAQRKTRAEQTLAVLFNRHDPFLHEALSSLSVSTLERLLYLAHDHVRIEDDNVHHGSYSPDTRDEAESARSGIFNILLEHPGVEAFQAMQRLATRTPVESRSRRYRELARRKAENDAELPVWSAAEVIHFEHQHTTPVKTGRDLLRLVISVLDDVQFHLLQGDASSRAVLKRAQDEDEVQNWLAEQINLRSYGRFHAHREAEIAQGNKPDLIISSAFVPYEVAIEIKHANKGWSVRDLETALKEQLAEDYLKPTTRRHGILLISYHTSKQWIDPQTKRKIVFSDLVSRLDAIAMQLIHNSNGPIEVRCVGIDATLLNLS